MVFEAVPKKALQQEPSEASSITEQAATDPSRAALGALGFEEATEQLRPPQTAPQVSGPLTPGQCVKAINYYRHYAASRYPVEVMERLQKAVEAPVSGVADSATAQAVARWQQRYNQTEKPRPQLAVDGIAGPRTLPSIFAFGLRSEAAVEGYAERVQDREQELEDKKADPEEFVAAIRKLVDETLVDEGLPKLLNATVSEGTGGGFADPAAWSIELGDKDFGRPRLVAATAYHEARHLEQAFRSACMLAKRPGATEASVAAGARVHEDVAQAAMTRAADKSKHDPVVDAVAMGWHEDEIGQPTDAQRKQRMGLASARFGLAAHAHQEQPSPARQARMQQAYVEYVSAYEGYRDSPIEFDGFAAGDAMSDALGVERQAQPSLETLRETALEIPKEQYLAFLRANGG